MILADVATSAALITAVVAALATTAGIVQSQQARRESRQNTTFQAELELRKASRDELGEIIGAQRQFISDSNAELERMRGHLADCHAESVALSNQVAELRGLVLALGGTPP